MAHGNNMMHISGGGVHVILYRTVTCLQTATIKHAIKCNNNNISANAIIIIILL